MTRLAIAIFSLWFVAGTAEAQSGLDARFSRGGTLRQVVYLDVLNLERAERSYYAANGVFTANVDRLRPHLAYDPTKILPLSIVLIGCAVRSENSRRTLQQECPPLFEPRMIADLGYFATEEEGALVRAQLLDDRAQSVDVVIQLPQYGFSCAARLEASAGPHSLRCLGPDARGQATEYWVDNPPQATWIKPAELQSLLEAGRRRAIRVDEILVFQQRPRQ